MQADADAVSLCVTLRSPHGHHVRLFSPLQALLGRAVMCVKLGGGLPFCPQMTPVTHSLLKPFVPPERTKPLPSQLDRDVS